MNIALWVVQGLLAVAYLLAGGMKASQPIDTMGKQMKWVRDVPPGLVRFIGAAEALGAIGLILPMLTGILPWLTPVAAVCLVVVQVAAFAFHVSRRETSSLAMNVVLLVLAAFVAYGRLVLST